MTTDVVQATRGLLVEALERFGDDEELGPALESCRRRLDEPLRVALAGRVKAGKSTLLNAIVGEELAPTDTGECTRVVTWYRFGDVPSVRLVPREGTPEQLPVRRDHGRLLLGTGDRAAHEVARLEVTWPTPALRDLVVIDTPGIASLSREVSARATEVLAPERTVSEVDAVVYLMRHLHASDAELMEAFGEASVGSTSPVGTLAVISRADEIGAGRIDAMVSAAEIAERYRRDPRVRAMALDVLPVAGLLAQGSRTLRQLDFDALRELSGLAGREREALLVSADRFTSVDHPDLTVATPQVRAELLERIGIYGVRLATALVRGPVLDATRLAHELARRSGLLPLTDALTSQLRQRADLLKTRTVLRALQQLLERHPPADGGGDDLLARVHAVRADDQALTELDWLVRLRRGEPEGLPQPARTEAERLLGLHGTSASARLGRSGGTSSDARRRSAHEAMVRWRRTAADPLTEPAHLPLVRTLLRSLDRVLTELEGPEEQERPDAQDHPDAQDQSDGQGRAGDPDGADASTRA